MKAIQFQKGRRLKHYRARRVLLITVFSKLSLPVLGSVQQEANQALLVCKYLAGIKIKLIT
jgi:hypothetical protein